MPNVNSVTKDSSDRVEIAARAIPTEERPVSSARLSDFGAFLGIYGGEHIAATEFVIGALLVTWGVPVRELILDLFGTGRSTGATRSTSPAAKTVAAMSPTDRPSAENL